MIQDNITFNNVAFQTYAAVNEIISRDSAAKINAGKGRPVVNAVSIDWNGAEVDENKVINTTGQLLAWIKEGLEAAAQSGGSASLTEDQIETIETCSNLLAFIKQYALSTAYADEHYQAKGDYVLASVYTENKAAIDAAIEALQQAVQDADNSAAIAQLQETVTNVQAMLALKTTASDVNTIVNQEIAKVVGAAPEALDTLKEIADKLGDNDDVVASLTNQIAEKANTADFEEFVEEVNNANETTAEALVQLQENINNIQLTQGATGPQGPKGDTGEAGPKGDKGDTGEAGPKGDKGDTGEAGPKGDKGDTGTFDSSALAGYVTIEQYNALLARVAALEAQSGGDEPVVDNAYLTPTRTKPTAESIAEMRFPAQKPTEGLTLETSEITRPTEVYLVYPTSWVTANNDDEITNPVITDHNGYNMGVLKDSTVTVDGVSYTIMVAELGIDTYTITFS